MHNNITYFITISELPSCVCANSPELHRINTLAHEHSWWLERTPYVHIDVHQQSVTCPGKCSEPKFCQKTRLTRYADAVGFLELGASGHLAYLYSEFIQNCCCCWCAFLSCGCAGSLLLMLAVEPHALAEPGHRLCMVLRLLSDGPDTGDSINTIVSGCMCGVRGHGWASSLFGNYSKAFYLKSWWILIMFRLVI